jgi:isoaspartyl peptidase/L-asparaginase-like protein (Ntn-hydrolase superfamily)
MTPAWALALHGGAGVKAGRDYSRAETFLAELIKTSAGKLAKGAPALEVVQTCTMKLEASGLYVAGRGSAPNRWGEVELDASLMDGRTGRAGAVSALQGIASPINCARAVMDRSSHVLLTGLGAADFALAHGMEAIGDLDQWLTEPDGFDPSDIDEGHGTVGAVALDLNGDLAAATSTGGTYSALPGRVGDTPLIGAGVWADDRVAISCTGEGEAFIRACAAHDVAARLRYGGQTPDQATQAVLARVTEFGGDGGLIAITANGEVLTPFNTPGMKRAWVSAGAPAMVGVGKTARTIG